MVGCGQGEGISMVDCAQCRRDISVEPFRYEADDGRILCERCFYHEGTEPEPRREGFGFLRGMAFALKLAAFIGVVGSLVFARSIYGYNPLVAIAAVIGGIAMFIVCFIVSELIRLGLSIHNDLMRISIDSDRFPSLRREQ
jgi:hypothetical protein